MTAEQQQREIMYHASIAPFLTLLNNGTITIEEYCKIDTILTKKYRPIFVRYMPLN